MLIKILFEFTRSFKLEKGRKKSNSFQYKREGWWWYPGQLYLFIFSFTGRWPITKGGGGGLRVEVYSIGLYKCPMQVCWQVWKRGQWCVTAESHVADSKVLVHSVFHWCFTVTRVGIGLLSSVCCRSLYLTSHSIVFFHRLRIWMGLI